MSQPHADGLEWCGRHIPLDGSFCRDHPRLCLRELHDVEIEGRFGVSALFYCVDEECGWFSWCSDRHDGSTRGIAHYFVIVVKEPTGVHFISPPETVEAHIIFSLFRVFARQRISIERRRLRRKLYPVSRGEGAYDHGI